MGRRRYGANASLNGTRPFPADNAWNQDIRDEPVDPNSATLIASCGTGTCIRTSARVEWRAERHSVRRRRGQSGARARHLRVRGRERSRSVSDSGGRAHRRRHERDGDRHVLVVDRDNWKLYELFDAIAANGVAARARRDLRPELVQRAAARRVDLGGRGGAADLAGSGALRRGRRVREIRHALRFTCPETTRRAYVPPGAALREQPHRREPAAHGDARAAAQPTYDISDVPAGRAGDPTGAEDATGCSSPTTAAPGSSAGPGLRAGTTDNLATLTRVSSQSFEVVRMVNIVP